MTVEKVYLLVYNTYVLSLFKEDIMAIKINKIDVWTYIKNFFLVVLGTGVLAFGTAVFLVPYELVTGGVSGIAIVLDAFFDNAIHFATLGEEFYITVLTWVLFLIGWIFLGKGFAAKTLLSTILYPMMYVWCTYLVDPELNVLNGYFMLQNSPYRDVAVLIAATLGGACVGVGCAIAFKGGGSTGGVDVLALLFSKIFKKVKSSYIIFAIDAAIVILGIFVIQDMVLSLLGIVSAFICAMMIDKVFLGNDGAYIAQIVSDEYEIISKGIIKQLDRTATIVDVVGAYSKEGKKMLIVSFSMREYADLVNIINHADPGAFVTISRAFENHGEGWTKEKK
jgi:uncharacterized membrane-anchored protein YitT (DUF2179 family)